METPSFKQIRYERPAERVARITLAREDIRNAQDRAMLYEINTALDIAMHDDEVRVVILAADGPHFSSGHHLMDASKIGEHGPPVMGVGGYELPGAEGYMAQELEIYLGFCWRWRNLPKPTIVQVQGKVIAGGLMLVWPFDLVVASEDAQFSDPVVAFGVNGVEFFAHAYELGHRKAKEMLFTGDSIGAAEAKTLGMVNQVVKREELESYTPGDGRADRQAAQHRAETGQDVGEPVAGGPRPVERRAVSVRPAPPGPHPRPGGARHPRRAQRRQGDPRGRQGAEGGGGVGEPADSEAPTPSLFSICS